MKLVRVRYTLFRDQSKSQYLPPSCLLTQGAFSTPGSPANKQKLTVQLRY